jgi:hypothetical protein
MRFLVGCVWPVVLWTLLVGCAEKKDRVSVKAPGVEVREKESGELHIKAPGVDIKTHH